MHSKIVLWTLRLFWLFQLRSEKDFLMFDRRIFWEFQGFTKETSFFREDFFILFLLLFSFFCSKKTWPRFLTIWFLASFWWCYLGNERLNMTLTRYSVLNLNRLIQMVNNFGQIWKSKISIWKNFGLLLKCPNCWFWAISTKGSLPFWPILAEIWYMWKFGIQIFIFFLFWFWFLKKGMFRLESLYF